MFVRYAIELDPPLPVEHDANEAQMMPGDEGDGEGDQTLVFRPKLRDDGVWGSN